MSGFNSSSDEESEDIDLSLFSISWLDMTTVGCDEKLGICGLPGCRFKNNWRSLEKDISDMKNAGVKEVFTLCSKGELNKYRVPRLLHEYTAADIVVHHYPFPDGQTPGIDNLMKMIDEIRCNLLNGTKTMIHCYGGLGRTCLVAVCLMMVMDESLDAETVMAKVRDLRGPGAVQSVKQYNFIKDFRQLQSEYSPDGIGERRSLSR